jgi:hypothetical protein
MYKLDAHVDPAMGLDPSTMDDSIYWPGNSETSAFNAKWRERDGHLFIYFFPPSGVFLIKELQRYWHETFGQALSDAAEDFFQSSYPRLQAMHCVVDGVMDAWKFGAFEFGGKPLMAAYVDDFLTRLASTLVSTVTSMREPENVTMADHPTA